MLNTATAASAAHKTSNRREGAELSGTTAPAAGEPQAPGGFFREARCGEAAAETERAQRGKGGKPMAG